MKEKTAQQILTGIILMSFIIVLLCTIFTKKDITSVSRLEAYQPDEIQYLDDGVILLSFDIDLNKDNRSSIVFFTSHQYVDVFVKNSEIYKLDASGGIWGIQQETYGIS